MLTFIMIPALIILFVVAVALVPLVQFMPSKRQRQLAELRELAAVNGLFVEFREIPGRAEFRKSAGANPGSVIYYGKRLPPSRAEPRKPSQWVTYEGQWQAVGKWQALPEPLASISAPLLAASVDDGSCGVYWVERDSPLEVEEICTALKAWSEQLSQGQANRR